MIKKVKLTVKARSYGTHCDACKRVTRTTSFVVGDSSGKEFSVLSGMNICSPCAEKGVMVDVDLDLGADREKGRETKRRVKLSRKLESEVAEQIGGSAQPASGSSRLPGFKGDIRRMGEWRVEHKFTEALRSFNLKLTDLAHIIGIATEANENPALIVDFRRVGEAFAVIPFTLFTELIDAAKEHSRPIRRRPR